METRKSLSVRGMTLFPINYPHLMLYDKLVYSVSHKHVINQNSSTLVPWTKPPVFPHLSDPLSSQELPPLLIPAIATWGNLVGFKDFGISRCLGSLLQICC